MLIDKIKDELLKKELDLKKFKNFLDIPENREEFFKWLISAPNIIKIITLDYLKDIDSKIFISDVIAWLEREKDPIVLAKLLIFLGNTREKKVIKYFLPFLNSKDRRIRANAVEGLGKIGDREIIKYVKPLIEDEDNRVKANVAISLWKFDDLRPEVEKLFLEMIADENKWMKASAMYALGELGLKKFVDYVFSNLMEDDEDLGRNALIALLGYAEKNSDLKEF